METATTSAQLAEHVFHVGYPKTGSTWLQRCVFPQLAGIRYGNLDPLVREFVRNLCMAGDESFFGAAMAAALDQAGRQRGGTLLVSDESICGPMFGDVDEGRRNAERVHAIAPAARILFFVRRQPEMLRSLYAQYVNMGGTHPLGDFLAGTAEGCSFSLRHIEYDQLAGVYVDLFGRDRVWIVPYESMRADSAAFLDSLCRFLGAEGSAGIETAWLNRSLSKPSLWLLRSWNRGFRESEFNPRPGVKGLPGGRAVRLVLQGQVDPIVRHLAFEVARPREGAVLEALAGEFAASNGRLQALCDYPLADWGYPLP